MEASSLFKRPSKLGGINPALFEPAEIIKMVLRKETDSRTETDLRRVTPLLREIQFFKDRNLKEEDLQEIAQALWLEAFRQGENVFDYGEKGSKFYIIIEGQVDVLVPNPDIRCSPMDSERAAKQEEAKQEIEGMLKAVSSMLDADREPTPFRIKTPAHLLVEERPSSRDSQRGTKSQRSTSRSRPNYIKTATLTKDMAFGELALMKNQPRAATIKCTRNCVCAVMDRQSYKKVLGKIEQKRLNQSIDFLQSLPFFNSWTRSTISKFQYLFERKEFIRNQIVYTEGDHADFVYLILSGEFELSLKCKAELKKEINISTYLGPQRKVSRRSDSSRELECTSSHIQRLASNPKPVNEVVRRTQSMRLMLLQKGNFFGDDDALARDRAHHAYTAKCISLEGAVLRIKAQDLIKKVKNHEDTFKMIIENVIHKEEYAQLRKKQNNRFQKASISTYALANPFIPDPDSETTTAPASPRPQGQNMHPSAQIISSSQSLFLSPQVVSSPGEEVATVGKVSFYSRKNSISAHSPTAQPSPRGPNPNIRKRTSNMLSVQNLQGSPGRRAVSTASSSSLLKVREYPRDGSNFASMSLIKGQNPNILSSSSIAMKPMTAAPVYRHSSNVVRHARIRSFQEATASQNVYLPQAFTFNTNVGGGKRLIPRMKPVRRKAGGLSHSYAVIPRGVHDLSFAR